MSKILVTGATGFIGGSVSIALEKAGYEIIGIDKKNEEYLTEYFNHLIIGDFVDVLKPEFSNHNFSHIVHCAGTSLVGPSVKDPDDYYYNNVSKTIKLLNWVKKYSPHTHIIFSSSASVYESKDLTIKESDNLNPLSPYAKSKKIIEDIILDYNNAYNLKYTIFRYFNACGALDFLHGQRPEASHIFARLFESALNDTEFELFGTDYATHDGTCVRDYVHVEDLAEAHLKAIEKSFVGIVNLGSGCGYSNFEIISEVKNKFSKNLKFKISDRRKGDSDKLIANVDCAKMFLEWQTKHNLKSIVESLDKWYRSKNYRRICL